MKVFVNVLVESDAYDDVDALTDAVVAAVEESVGPVKWHKGQEASDR